MDSRLHKHEFETELNILGVTKTIHCEVEYLLEYDLGKPVVSPIYSRMISYLASKAENGIDQLWGLMEVSTEQMDAIINDINEEISRS